MLLIIRKDARSLLFLNQTTDLNHLLVDWRLSRKTQMAEVVFEECFEIKPHDAATYLGVFTFCICCKIIICLVCIVASFKLFCV